MYDMFTRIVQTTVERQFFKIHTRGSPVRRIFRAPSKKVQHDTNEEHEKSTRKMGNAETPEVLVLFSKRTRK